MTAFPDELTRARCVLLTTYRRDGRPVATPVWHVVSDGVLLATTAENSGKVKRLRHTERVTVAPCTQRGRRLGPSFTGRARLLDAAGTRRAEALKRRRYPLVRLIQVIDRVRRGPTQVGIAVVPA